MIVAAVALLPAVPLLALGRFHLDLAVLSAISLQVMLADGDMRAPPAGRYVEPEDDRRALWTGLAVLAASWVGLVEHALVGSSVWIGVFPAVGGTLLRRWAITELGPRFVTEVVVSTRVVTGPYRWLAHPSEVGLLAAIAGIALIYGSIGAMVIVVGMVPGSIARMWREDAVWQRGF